MAFVAVPEDECGVGLDHFEGVLAFAWFRHYCWREISNATCRKCGMELTGCESAPVT